MASATFPHGDIRHGAIRHSVLCLATAGLLMGCVEGSGTASGNGTQTTAAPLSLRGASSREVEAPDVFQTSDSALWDGRPSLGGIWVASPDVTDPQRVVILNPATGKTVNGALFRRERENPGPPLQVSSDAAEALGMLAGQPTQIRVTALRRQAEGAPAPAGSEAGSGVAVAAPAPAEGAAVADAAAAPATDDTAALAAAALAATGTAAVAGADAATDTTAAALEPAKPKTWKERRAEAKARREAEKAAKAAAAAAAAGDPAAGEAPAEAAATAENAAVATVETAPLDARSPETAAAESAAGEATAAGTTAEAVTPPEPVPAKKKTRREIREEQKAAAAAAAAAAAPTVAAPAPASTGGRTIQIASFSKEENAKRAVDALAKIDVSAQAQQSQQSGKEVWGVVATGDDALLAKIKGAGFADAFYLN